MTRRRKWLQKIHLLKAYGPDNSIGSSQGFVAEKEEEEEEEWQQLWQQQQQQPIHYSHQQPVEHEDKLSRTRKRERKKENRRETIRKGTANPAWTEITYFGQDQRTLGFRGSSSLLNIVYVQNVSQWSDIQLWFHWKSELYHITFQWKIKTSHLTVHLWNAPRRLCAVGGAISLQ